MRIQLVHKFEEIISIENLLEAWREFLRGKRGKRDVQEFQFRLMDNILSLHEDLTSGVYRHGGYKAFKINDPKPRDIHKATVRDRLLHHAIYRVLYPFFDRTFIADSFSCRNDKGTHAALNRFRSLAHVASKNNTRTCWVLKCDIRKFFANINHSVLMEIISQYTADEKLLWLLKGIIGSFSLWQTGIGLPLGNLTSQLFVNVYMNEFDRFAKHKLMAKFYIRYADDFVILSDSRSWLDAQIPRMAWFLRERLRLALHPQKVFVKTSASGIDFLGWVHFPGHRVLRTITKKRMIKRMSGPRSIELLNSYLGMLSHGNASKLRRHVLGTNS